MDKPKFYSRSLRNNISSNGFRIESLEGVEYVVVPAVMARTDVTMNGARYSEEALSFMVTRWNDRPVTISHPKNGQGVEVDALTPEMIDEFGIGRIFNASYRDGVLSGEIWIDKTKADEKAPGLISRVQNGERIDVSTGMLVLQVDSEDPDADSDVVFLAPNHIAVLPDEKGACSGSDGCGIYAHRANSRSVEMLMSERMGVPCALLSNALKSIEVDQGTNSKSNQPSRIGNMKDKLIAQLAANSKVGKTKDELEGMEEDELIKLAFNCPGCGGTCGGAGGDEGSQEQTQPDNEKTSPAGDDEAAPGGTTEKAKASKVTNDENGTSGDDASTINVTPEQLDAMVEAKIAAAEAARKEAAEAEEAASLQTFAKANRPENVPEAVIEGMNINALREFVKSLGKTNTVPAGPFYGAPDIKNHSADTTSFVANVTWDALKKEGQ